MLAMVMLRFIQGCCAIEVYSFVSLPALTWNVNDIFQVGTGGPGGALKRELTFPPECVEGAVPAPEKRRRLTKADVAPVDAWRIVMALKSGLLAETCWALDILNILLFDDNCIGKRCNLYVINFVRLV